MPIWFAPLRIRAVSATLAASLMLAGCATQQAAYNPNLSPAENQLRQANSRFNQTVGEGAVTGAVIGGLAGLALGGRNRAGAAALGAGLGGAVGAGAGYMVARNNLSRSSSEAQMNDAIKQAAADAQAYQSSAAAARQIADSAEADVARLRGQYRSRQITQEQYRSSLAHYQGSLDILNQQVTSAQKTATQMRQDGANIGGANGAQLASTANQVSGSERELEAQRVRLSRLMAGAA